MGLWQDTESGGFGNLLKHHPGKPTDVSDIPLLSQAPHHRVGDEIQILTPREFLGTLLPPLRLSTHPNRVRKAPGHSQLTIITTHPSPPGSAAPQQFIVRARPQIEEKNQISTHSIFQRQPTCFPGLVGGAMFLLQVAIIFWTVGFLLAVTLRGVIHLLTAITGLFFQLMMQVFNGRT
jgi:hypothetical protein